MAVQPLPQELIDSIIDCLSGDKKSLLRCSLVCRSWSARSTSTLWSRIILDSRLQSTKDIAIMFESSAPLLHVQQLIMTSLNEAMTVNVITHLHAFPNLTSLVLRAVSIALPSTPGTILSPSLQDLTLLKSHFGTAHDMQSLLAGFPSLRSLAYGPYVWIDHGPGSAKDSPLIRETGPSTRRALFLDTLTLDLCLGVFDIVSFAHLTVQHSIQVKHLHVRVSPASDTPGLEELWSTLMPSVRSVSWDSRCAQRTSLPMVRNEYAHVLFEALWNQSGMLDLTNGRLISSIAFYSPAKTLPSRFKRLRAALDTLPAASDPQAPSPECLTIIIDNDNTPYDTADLRDLWNSVWPWVMVQPSTFFPCKVITLVTTYPLRWDDNLVDGVQALGTLATLRFQDGFPDETRRTYIPRRQQ